MGVWSTGLYSGDFALDLRSTIRAVSRLPYDGDKLVEILCETEPGAANHPEDADHTTFWLVTADQFAKRGIKSDRARETALKIIDGGSDLAMLGKLGMDPAGLRKRGKVLEELRARVSAPLLDNTRSVLQKPQPYLMAVGDVLSFPTCEGHCINPYFASKERDRSWKGQDGWNAAVIVDRGRAFEFLTWYRPVVSTPAKDKPALEELHGQRIWQIERPGTCSASHFKKMEMEKAGEVRVDRDKLIRAFGDLSPGTSAAINDISIANSLLRAVPTTKPLRTIPTLREILAG